jgi:hypothetical protein
MAQSSSTVSDVWWNGLGAALVGGLVAAGAAILVVFLTRAYDRRHVREQEARAAARELIKESLVFAKTVGKATTPSLEDQQVRSSAWWSWLGAQQAAQASIQAVNQDVVDRLLEAAERSQRGLNAADAVTADAVTMTAPMTVEKQKRMGEAIQTAITPVLRLELILSDWIGTRNVADFDE